MPRLIESFDSLIDCSRIWIHNHLSHKWIFKHLAKRGKWLSCVVLWFLICIVHRLSVFTMSHMHIGSSLCNWLNVKDFNARNMCNISNLSDCNGTWTHDQLVCKGTLILRLFWARRSLTFRDLQSIDSLETRKLHLASFTQFYCWD